MIGPRNRAPQARNSLHAALVGAIIIICGVVSTAAMARDVGARHRDVPAKIDRIVFSGSPTDPTITVIGREFEKRPGANPRGGTSNFGKCGPIKGETGNDFGNDLWVSDQSQLWSAGYTPYVDCMGLVVIHYSEHKIVLGLGSFYATHYAQRNGFDHGIYMLTPGDNFEVKVRGAQATVRVHYDD